jgi:hypothetical protein
MDEKQDLLASDIGVNECKKWNSFMDVIRNCMCTYYANKKTHVVL